MHTRAHRDRTTNFWNACRRLGERTVSLQADFARKMVKGSIANCDVHKRLVFRDARPLDLQLPLALILLLLLVLVLLVVVVVQQRQQ